MEENNIKTETCAYQSSDDETPVYRVPQYQAGDDQEQEMPGQTGNMKKQKSTFASKMVAGLTGFLIGTVLTIGVGALAIIVTKASDKETLIRAYIEEYFMNEIDESAMEEGKYRGMVEALGDDYSTYYTYDEMNELMQTTEGVYRGIGVMLSQDIETKAITVVRCYADSPAEKAGLQAGDILYQIDGESVEGMELTDVTALIKGADEDGALLTMIREGEADYLEFQVVPTEVEYPMVESRMLEDGIGYVAIYSFTQTTYEQFHAQMEDLTEQGMTKVIVDLRDNTGGLMSSVTDILNSILPEGVMVYTVDKYGERKDYYSEGQTPLEIPMVVLVNGYTASASEIFAGAVRDYDMATLVGTTTFGKGVVQNTFRLADGSGLKLTAATYYTPDGTNIHGNGLEPDVEVELNTEPDEDGNIVDNQLEKALEVIKGM